MAHQPDLVGGTPAVPNTSLEIIPNLKFGAEAELVSRAETDTAQHVFAGAFTHSSCSLRRIARPRVGDQSATSFRFVVVGTLQSRSANV